MSGELLEGGAAGSGEVRAGWRCGWILDPRRDLGWFLLLPGVAVLVAIGCHHWLPYVALASVNLWITIPHHCSTWVRTYGLHEDLQRWRGRLLLGPLLIAGIALLGHRWAPATLLLLVTMWDQQHSIMQQHGFARIYDFKAGTGTPRTGRLDLVLNWVLYGNLFLTAPLFVQYWLRELFFWRVPIGVDGVKTLQGVSWVVTGVVLTVYAVHVVQCLRRGDGVNPVKLLFLLASYGLWYGTAWHTDSILVFGIAHRLMHGLQYMVIVRVYLDRKLDRRQASSSLAEVKTGGGMGLRLVGRGGLWRFVGVSVLYALVFQLLVGQPRPLENFGFGVIEFQSVYGAIPELGVGRFSEREMYGLFAMAMVDAVAMVHYYFDSFIWKVSDRRVQEGLA